jgi:hypothetical protein
MQVTIHCFKMTSRYVSYRVYGTIWIGADMFTGPTREFTTKKAADEVVALMQDSYRVAGATVALDEHDYTTDI